MVDIYTQPELYDAIHKKYEWDKSILTSTAKIAGGPVLELTVGTGRLTQLIVELGFAYTGIQISIFPQPLFLNIMDRYAE